MSHSLHKRKIKHLNAIYSHKVRAELCMINRLSLHQSLVAYYPMAWAKKWLSTVTQGKEENQYPNSGIIFLNLKRDTTYIISEKQKIWKWYMLPFF